MRGHATYEQLQNLTLPLWKSFYFFNLTNPKEFEAGDTPILKEVGPYSYRYVGSDLCAVQLLTLSRLHQIDLIVCRLGALHLMRASNLLRDSDEN